MPGDSCAACQSGRKGSTYEGSYYAIPTGEKRAVLRDLWLKAIPVEILGKCKRPKLCSLHFDPEDFQTERKDSNTARNDARGEMKRKFLKETAVPHIWPELPDYFSKPSPPRRSDTASSESRNNKEMQLSQKRLMDAQENDKVYSLQDVRQTIQNQLPLPGVIETVDAEGNLIFVGLEVDPLVKVKFSLLIRDDLSVQLTHGGVLIPPKK